MNQPLYVIGDVHGMYDRLGDLYDKIIEHKNSKNVINPTLCFVGDYIDRGPDSRLVLQWVKHLVENGIPGFNEVTALKGNHEDMMVKSETDRHMGYVWLSNGGDRCLDSFGFDPRKHTTARDVIDHNLFDWVANLPHYYEIGKVAVAHAGIDMEHLPASAHSSEQLLWSRQLRMHAHSTYRYTVHGHTPMKAPLVDEHVAYIDTGAVFGGSLTCLFIPDTVNPVHTEMEIVDE